MIQPVEEMAHLVSHRSWVMSRSTQEVDQRGEPCSVWAWALAAGVLRELRQSGAIWSARAGLALASGLCSPEVQRQLSQRVSARCPALLPAQPLPSLGARKRLHLALGTAPAACAELSRFGCHWRPYLISKLIRPVEGVAHLVSYPSCIHATEPRFSGRGASGARHPSLLEVNTVSRNIKKSLSGTARAIGFQQHAAQYAGQIELLFVRRFDLRCILTRMVRVARLTVAHPLQVVRQAGPAL